MKIRNCFYAILGGVAVAAGFASCSDDDYVWDPSQLGSKIEMKQTRGFVLNEGIWGSNNACLNYFDYLTDNLTGQDLFQVQNEGKRLGDVGQDIIEYNGSIYVSVNSSNYIVRMNGVGKEQARVSFAGTELGEVRYLAAGNGYVYATSYGGYVTKMDAGTLEIIGSVKVGHHPEKLIIKDGCIYCVDGSYYPEDDNRLSVISEKDFRLIENVEIIDNPQAIVDVDGQIAIQGYGPDWVNNPVVLYDAKAKKCSEIGYGSYIAAYGSSLYVLYSKTSDWVNYQTELYSYDVRTGRKNADVLKNMPGELAGSATNGLCINQKTGHIYILVTKYEKGDGVVYHFDSNGNYVGKFTSGGQNPKKIIFVD